MIWLTFSRYKVKLSDVQNNGGAGLLDRYGNSLVKALASVYPEKDWLGWKFQQVPRGYWNDIGNQRKFFEEIAKELNVQNAEDWLKISATQVKDLGGSGLLSNHYNNSVVKALEAVYPEKKSVFDKKLRHREILDKEAQRLGITNHADWYGVQDLQQDATQLITNRYDGSLYKALSLLYPQYPFALFFLKRTSSEVTCGWVRSEHL
jgi:hypothetical protein